MRMDSCEDRAADERREEAGGCSFDKKLGRLDFEGGSATHAI